MPLALKAVPSAAAHLRSGADANRAPPLREGTRTGGSRLSWRSYPRLLHRPRDGRDGNNLEWVTPGHPLFEAIRRHTYYASLEDFGKGACFYSLPARSARRASTSTARASWMGSGRSSTNGCSPWRLPKAATPAPGAGSPRQLRPRRVARPDARRGTLPEATTWLHEHGLAAIPRRVRTERLTEVDRVADHVELSLTELLQGRRGDRPRRCRGGAEARRGRGSARAGRDAARRAAGPPRPPQAGTRTPAGAHAPGGRAAHVDPCPAPSRPRGA